MAPVQKVMGDSNTIGDDSTVVVSESLTLADLGGEAVILDLNSGNYFGLNEVGTLVVEMAQQPVAVRDVLAKLETEYDVEPARLRQDVLGFLQQVVEADLVRLVGSDTLARDVH